MKEGYERIGNSIIKKDLSQKEKDALLDLNPDPTSGPHDPSQEEIIEESRENWSDILGKEVPSQIKTDYFEQTNEAFRKHENMAQVCEEWVKEISKIIHDYTEESNGSDNNPTTKKTSRLVTNTNELVSLLKESLTTMEVLTPKELTYLGTSREINHDIEKLIIITKKLSSEPDTITNDDLVHLEKIQDQLEEEAFQLRAIFHAKPKEN